ncbi:MAG: peptidoglycan binding domain-containing protein [Actinobacteria bacterium]|nr:peptidoglycan binding domain-containing protein [Actinomycetota bacterium]
MEGKLLSLKNPRDRARSRTSFDTREAFGGLSGSRSKSVRRRRRIIVPVLVICAIVAALVAIDYWTNSGKIFQGVSIGGVSLGGKTPEQARKVIEEQGGDTLQKIQFTGGPEEFSLSAKEMDLNLDPAATADQAYAVGREGSIPRRIGERLQAAWGTFYTTPVVDYDREAVRAKIQNWAKRVNQKPQDAYVSVSGSNAKASESREGYALDVAATAANVDKALDNMSSEVEVVGDTVVPAVLTSEAEKAAGVAEEAMSQPVTLTADGEKWEFSPEEIGQSLSFSPREGELRVGLDREQLKDALSDVYKALTVKPVEAGYKFSGDQITVTKSNTGKEIKDEELFDALEAGLFEGKREYEVPVNTVDPELTTDQAEKLKPTERIGTYRTDYTLSSDKSPERVENLQIASNAISGTLVAPGEVFSVNDVVSPLEYEKTHVIIEGKEEMADGGGLCQVASTLYNAANYAGVEIVERHPHDAQLPYIRPGLDATVWFGSLDMKFKNTTDGYLFLQEYVADDGYIYAEIWGQPTGKKVELDSEPEYLGSDYSKWVTYQKVTDEDGKVIFDDVFHKDTYKPLVDDKGKTWAPNDPVLNIAPVNY